MTRILTLIAFVTMLCLTAGCQSQAAMLHPQIVAANAVAVSGQTLYSANVLSLAEAKKLSVDLHVADAGFKAALSSIQLGQTPSLTVQSQILASLNQIALDLQTTPQARAIVARTAARYRAVSGDKKSVSLPAVIAIINLVVQLTPSVVNELNALFTGVEITTDDCVAALNKFEVDLAAFDATLSP